jgi:hypothetical protein
MPLSSIGAAHYIGSMTRGDAARDEHLISGPYHALSVDAESDRRLVGRKHLADL